MKRLLFIMFVSIPFLITLLIFITPDRPLSENENRSLKTRSTISLNTFQQDFEEFLSDQIFMRDELVSAKSRLMYTVGKRDLNGCYICKDRFIQKITDSDVDIEKCEKYADKINVLADKVDTYVMLVPSAGIVQSQYLPENSQMYDYDALYNNLSSRLCNAHMIDVKQALTADGAYYLTDHHWTADGAYLAYEKLCSEKGTQPEKFSLEAVTDDFRGTLYSKALINKQLCDTIVSPVIDDKIKVTADGKAIELYDRSALDTKDKYNFFEGGNHGLLMIENYDCDNSDVLLILKDSFANSLVPYLISDYKKIIMLDERYAFESPSEIIEREGVTQMLVVKEIVS